MVCIQEADVMPASPSSIEVFAKRMLINLALQPFRADDGTMVQVRGLSLQLCDFAPRTYFANVSQGSQSMTVVRIS